MCRRNHILNVLLRSATLAICAVFVAGTIGHAAFGQEASGQQSPASSYLVLENGHLLEGEVRQMDDGNFEVKTAGGSRLVVQSSQALFAADSLVDAYWQQVGALGASDVPGHARLFDWCVRNGLMDLAQNQINIVQDLDPDFDRLPTLASRLQMAAAREQADARRLAMQESAPAIEPEHQTAAEPEPSVHQNVISRNASANLSQFSSPPSIPGTQNANQQWNNEPTMDADGTMMPGESGIALVSYEADAETITSPSLPATVSGAELDRLTRSMPNGSVGHFRRHVEPLLMNHCVQCHGANSKSLTLMRRAPGQTIPRRMSQRNLLAAFNQVDKADPLHSHLLDLFLAPHGGNEEPFIEPNSRATLGLAVWMIEISDQPDLWRQQLHVVMAPETTAAVAAPETLDEAGPAKST